MTPPECVLDISQVVWVTCSPEYLLSIVQVMASTHSRILSFDMKGSGKEGRPTVRSVCGLLLQQPPHRRQPISSGSWGGWLALRASGTGPSRCHYCPRRWGSPDTTPWCCPEAGPKARVTMTPRPAAFARAGDCSWETLPEFSFVRSFVLKWKKWQLPFGSSVMRGSSPPSVESLSRRGESVGTSADAQPGSPQLGPWSGVCLRLCRLSSTLCWFFCWKIGLLVFSCMRSFTCWLQYFLYF